ncbi:MAG: DUF1947 domain-containing protein [Nanoarchaeota archaeon]|nr:DUF1947 domain-containing protein [Nanoarchaeota archaeon]
MKRTRIKAKELNKELADAGYAIEFGKKDKVEILEDKEKSIKVILINEEILFVYLKDQLVPSLKLLQTNMLLKTVTVDMGAVKFVVNGADIMRPGIIKIEEGFNEGDFIAIVDMNNLKPLATGKALFNSEQMQQMSLGKVIQNVHFVGDEIWKLNI